MTWNWRRLLLYLFYRIILWASSRHFSLTYCHPLYHEFIMHFLVLLCPINRSVLCQKLWSLILFVSLVFTIFISVIRSFSLLIRCIYLLWSVYFLTKLMIIWKSFLYISISFFLSMATETNPVIFSFKARTQREPRIPLPSCLAVRIKSNPFGIFFE